MFATRQLTEDGLERTFALNHMAYFVITQGLRERLLASGPARIINTASAAHRGASLDFDDLQSAKSFGAMKVYGRSKLCNILFTRELARRLQRTDITANCLHPGFVATRFGDQSGPLMSRIVWLAKFFAVSPAKGAETIVYLASSPDVAKTTGQYFYEFPTRYPVVAGPGRPICTIALAAQCSTGWHLGIAVSRTANNQTWPSWRCWLACSHETTHEKL